MSNIEASIEMLKSRVNAGHLAKARALATKETAQASFDTAMAAIMAEFGLDNLSAARDKLEDLQADLQSKVDGVAAQLDAMEL